MRASSSGPLHLRARFTHNSRGQVSEEFVPLLRLLILSPVLLPSVVIQKKIRRMPLRGRGFHDFKNATEYLCQKARVHMHRWSKRMGGGTRG